MSHLFSGILRSGPELFHRIGAVAPTPPQAKGSAAPGMKPPRRIEDKTALTQPVESSMRHPSDFDRSEEGEEPQCDPFRILPKICPYNRPISHEKNQTYYIALLAKISPICAPYNAHNRAIAAVFQPLFPESIKYPFGIRSARKTRLRERFNSPDCQNKADSGLFLKGARFGLRLDSERSNPGSIRARISVARIRGIGAVAPFPPMREERRLPRLGAPATDQGPEGDRLIRECLKLKTRINTKIYNT